MSFMCPTCIKDSHAQLGYLEVILVLRLGMVNKPFVLRTVMVNMVRYMSYCIKESHSQ